MLTARRPPHPARLVLIERGLTVKWLAETLGYSQAHVSHMLLGSLPASRRFRAATALALGLPESELFRHEAEADAA